MNPTKEAIETAEYLRIKYPELSIFESLQVAAQIVHTEVLANGLLVTPLGNPVALEAIAMSIGYEPNKNDSIIDAINRSSFNGED